jgi:hypothetical protein
LLLSYHPRREKIIMKLPFISVSILAYVALAAAVICYAEL